MLCEFAPHDDTHVQCTRCRGLFPHGGQPVDRVRRTCPGEGQTRKAPSLVTRAGNAGQALIRNALNGFRRVPEEIRRQRQSICESNVCGRFGKGWCELCGCHLQTKQSLAAESCPDSPSRWIRWTDRQPGPLRVAFLTPGLGQGGAERWILDLCQYLPTQDVQVSSVWLLDGGQSWQPFVNELADMQIPVYGGSNLMAGRPNAMTGIIRSDHQQSMRAALDQADILITWGIPHLDRLLRGSGFNGLVVVVSHGEADATRDLLAESLSGTTDFAAVSQQAQSAFPREVQSRVKILWNGCNTDRLQIIQGRAVQRSLWGLENDEIAIGYLGRLHHQKRPLIAVQAALACGDKSRPVLIGEGLHQTEIIREARRMAGDRLIAPGPISPIGDALAALDVWILGSPAEGFSIALLEAWAAGVPVVSTRVGCLDEIEAAFGAMVTPIPVDPSDTDLRSAIHHALSPSGRAIADHARQFALKHLTAELSAQRWAEWLREICPVRG